jgi:hypothetical protein
VIVSWRAPRLALPTTGNRTSRSGDHEPLPDRRCRRVQCHPPCCIQNANGHGRAARFGQPRRLPDPADLALRLVYLIVVDRSIPPPHQAVVVELPQLIPMRSPPPSLCVVRLVLEPDRYTIAGKAPEIFL